MKLLLLFNDLVDDYVFELFNHSSCWYSNSHLKLVTLYDIIYYYASVDRLMC